MKNKKEGDGELAQSLLLDEGVIEAMHHHETLFNSASVGLCLFNIDMRYQCINDYLATMNGFTAKEHIGQSIREINTVLADQIEPTLEQVFETGQAISNVEIAHQKNTQPTILSTWNCDFYPVVSGGSVNGVSMTAWDISECKQREKDLIEKENRFRTIVSTAVDAIISINDGGIINEVNNAAERMFGYSCTEMAGNNVSMLMPSPYKEQHDNYLDRYRATGKTSIIGIGREIVAQRKNGDVFPIYLSVGEVEDAHCYTAIIRDLTQSKALERQLLSSIEKTQRDIGQNLHDDIGQEMTALSLKADALVSILDKTAQPSRELAEDINASLDRVRSKLRALSRGLVPVAVDSIGLTNALYELAEETSKVSGIPCSFVSGGEITIEDDLVARQFYHIAQEAINNVIQHARARRIDIRMDIEDDLLMLRVQDDGIGLPEKPMHGSGMGMHIMKYRCDLIGGRVSIQSSKAGGTLVSCAISSADKNGQTA